MGLAGISWLIKVIIALAVELTNARAASSTPGIAYRVFVTAANSPITD